jgi:hypothetical protein
MEKILIISCQYNYYTAWVMALHITFKGTFQPVELWFLRCISALLIEKTRKIN